MFLLRTLAVAVATTILAAGCSPASQSASNPTAASGTAGGSDQSDIVLGAILSTTGTYAGVGASEAAALDAFQKTAPPINGRKFRIMIENDQSDPSQSAAAARTFIENKEVLGIIGPSVTATMLGAHSVLQPARIPTIYQTPNPYPNFNQEAFLFSPNIGSLPAQATAYIDVFKARGIPAEKVALMANDDASGQATTKELKDRGLPSSFLTPTSLTDYSATLRQLQSSDLRAIINIQSGSNAGYVRKSQTAIGYDVPMILAPNTLNPSFMEVAGSDADGVLVLTLGSLLPADQLKDKAQSEQAADYQQRFNQVVGRDAKAEGTTASMAWDSALSFYVAAQNAKSFTRDEFQQIMTAQDYMGAGGRVKRASGDHAGFQASSFQVGEVKGGQVVLATQ